VITASWEHFLNLMQLRVLESSMWRLEKTIYIRTKYKF